MIIFQGEDHRPVAAQRPSGTLPADGIRGIGGARGVELVGEGVDKLVPSLLKM